MKNAPTIPTFPVTELHVNLAETALLHEMETTDMRFSAAVLQDQDVCLFMAVRLLLPLSPCGAPPPNFSAQLRKKPT
jgi:hypothetical protein